MSKLHRIYNASAPFGRITAENTCLRVLLPALLWAITGGGAAFGQVCHFPAPTCPLTCGSGCTVSCDPNLGHGQGATASCQPRCVGETLSCVSSSAYVDKLSDVIRIEEAFDTVHGSVRVPAVGNLPIIQVVGNAACTGGSCNPATGAGCAFPCIVGQSGTVYSDPSTGLTLPGILTNGRIRVTDTQYVIQPGDVGNLGNQFTFVGTDLCTSCCSNCPQTCDTATASSSTIVPNCNDQDGCTIDCCSAGVCSHPSDCVGATSCRGTDGQVTTIPPITCDDSSVCTADACVNDTNPATACCSFTPIPCPALACQRNTGCDPTAGCQYVFDCREPGANCCPDDGNPCTHEFCDQATGTCGATTDCTTPPDCDDGLNCTVETCINSCCGHNDLCPPGSVCCADGASCDDHIGCTDDACGPLGCCEHVPHACPPGSLCCADGASCDDNNACTDDSCGPDGCCVYVPHVCPAVPCQRNTGCDPVGGCQYTFDCREPGSNCCPDDGNACTHESCDAATGTCGLTRDCTTPADCDDQLDCTVDSCANSCCGHSPLCSGNTVCCADGASCNDGDACTDDTCVSGCCGHNAHCAPGIVCCADGTSCDDSDDCTNDACVGGCCTHTGIPGCGPTIPTVSQWGLVVFSLLLLSGAKIYFGRRQEIA